MRVRTDPLTLAVALGLLGPAALVGEGRLEIHPDDVEELNRVASDAAPESSGETVSYEVEMGVEEE